MTSSVSKKLVGGIGCTYLSNNASSKRSVKNIYAKAFATQSLRSLFLSLLHIIIANGCCSDCDLMRLCTWNVNGLESLIRKGYFTTFIQQTNPGKLVCDVAKCLLFYLDRYYLFPRDKDFPKETSAVECGHQRLELLSFTLQVK